MVSPAFAPLHGLPPAFFSVGSADHLLDDTLLMATRWVAAGNEAELFVAPDMPHGFPAYPCGITRAWDRAANAWLADILTRPPREAEPDLVVRGQALMRWRTKARCILWNAATGSSNIIGQAPSTTSGPARGTARPPPR